MNFSMLLEQVTRLLNGLTGRQKAVIGVSTFSVIAFIVFLVLYTSKDRAGSYAVLFEGINASDSALIIEQLEKDNVPYKIINEGTISVPKNVVYKERIAVSSLGIPKSSKVGFELFDKQDFGETGFAQKIKYLRALEGELSRTVLSLLPIQDAKVHIAIPEKTVFVEKETKATASVVVRLQPSMKLSFKQINGIKNLISASVSKMSSDDVSIVDDSGTPLGDSELGEYDSEVVKAQIRYKKDYERAYEKKIEELLSPILGGRDSVVAKVSIDFDFQQKKIQSEVFDPESVVRSEKTIEEKKEGESKKEVSGVPGAISNIGPIEPNKGSSKGEKYEKSSTTTNYEISKKVTDIKGEFATIRKISVAVVVDGKYKNKKDKDGNELDILEYQPLEKEQLENIRSIVKNSFGYDKTRGDTLSVNNFEFNSSINSKKPPSQVVEFANNYLNPFLPLLKYLFAGILLIIFYKKIIAPFGERMLHNFEEDIAEELQSDESLVSDEDTSALDEYNKMKKKVESELGIGGSLDKDDIKHDVMLERLKKDIEASPEEVAKIIKSMVDEREMF